METENDRQTPDQVAAPESNPSDSELDVEGPNESAPGHEPASPGTTPDTSREGSK